MAERTTVTQVVQLGVEATKGTSTAANRRLPGLMVEMGIDGSQHQIEASGHKFPTGHAPGKEWTTGKISGQPSFDEIVYPFMAMMSYTAPTQIGATDAYTWAHSIGSTSEDTVKTFTVEQGSAVRAQKASYGVVTEFGLTGDREKVAQSGSMMMQQFTDGITLTAAPTEIPQVPILPEHFSIYLDAASGDLGTTKLTRALKWDWAIKNRFGPLWTVDRAEASWAAPVELPIDGQFKVMVEADAQGMALLPLMRAGTRRFVRLEAVAAQEAGAGNPYSFTCDMAVEVAEKPKTFSDSDGVYAIEWTLGLVHDATWGKAIDAAVVNTLTGA